MGRKRSNGEGSISYDSRRKRYRVKVTVGWELNEETGRSKQITKSLGSNFKTKGEAARALAEYQDERYNITQRNITFSELFNKWLQDRVENKSSLYYRVKAAYRYCSSLYDKQFKDISILDMRYCIDHGSVIDTRGKTKGQTRLASPQTKMLIKSLFNQLFSYAIEARIVNHNYAKDFSLDAKIFKQQELEHTDKMTFSNDQLMIMWSAISFVPFTDMILYQCYSGWRPTELTRLKVSDVNWEERYIIGGMKTASGRGRIVPIHPLVEPIVRKYYDEAIQYGSEYLFNDVSKKRGLGLSLDQYDARFKKAMSVFNFPGHFTPHCARHTFITRAQSPEVNMHRFILKRIVGHKIDDITERVYTHRTVDELRNEMLKIKE